MGCNKITTMSEMKRVSFEVAKAIKKAGYSQEGPIYYTSEGELFNWNM